jgi:hypothetical protein
MRISLKDFDAAYAKAVFRRGPRLSIFEHEFEKAEVDSALAFAAHVGERERDRDSDRDSDRDREEERPRPRKVRHGGRPTRREFAHAILEEA